MTGQEPDNTSSPKTPKPSSWGFRRVIKLFVFLAIIVSFIAAIIFIWVTSVLTRPSLQTDDIVLEIRRGDGTVVISKRLNQIGIIHHPFVYQVEKWRRGRDYSPRAGEYLFPKGVNLSDAMTIIHEGKAIQHSITIPEGLTSEQIIAMLNADPRLDGKIASVPDEGSMLPETYFFLRHTDRNDIISRMQQSHEIQFAEIWAERAADYILKDIDEAIILASMVEKETGISGERGLVASVFINRLRKGMRLQSDPTVIYGLDQAGISYDHLHEHLKHDSPWNTYVIKALPKTPIANPGLASFRAVVHPEASDYYYFVADGKGGHRFAKTYDEHKANIQLWKNSENNQ